MGEGTQQAAIRPCSQRSFASTTHPRCSCPALGLGFGESKRTSSHKAAHTKHSFMYPKPASYPGGRQSSRKPAAHPRPDMKAACPQGPATSGLNYVQDTGASSKSGPPSNVLMRIITSSISSENTITITAVITQALSYRQQFLCNTATKRHPSNAANPTALREPASQLVPSF